MKKILKYIAMGAALLASGTALSSCDDELAQAPIVQPAPEIGDGTWQNPLQTWQANLGTTVDGRTSNWVTGYIVGYVDTSDGNKKILGNAGALQSNMVIAQYPYDEADWAERGYTIDDCVPVQLPSGVVRTALNIADNPGNLNKQVSLRGTTGSKYCGYYGVRQANDYNWGPTGRYEEPIQEMGDSYYCDFTASRDINYYIERGWTTLMTKGGLSGWYWKENSGVTFLTVSAYLGTANGGPYENWVISPAFNLDTAREKTLSFSTQGAYANESTLEVYIMTNKNPLACEPVKLDCVIAQAPESGYSQWVSSGTIDLSEYSGTVYIGFRYWSAHGGQNGSSDFGMTNFNIGGADPAEWEVIDPATIATFRPVSSVEAGKSYAFVFDGDKLMLPLGGNYGNFGVKKITFNEDGTFSGKRADVFTLEALPEYEGEYAIVDPNGKYIYMKGTYTNFNVSFSLEDAYRWSFIPNDEGVFEIRNVTRNLDMIYEASKDYIGTTGPTWYNGNGARLYVADEDHSGR